MGTPISGFATHRVTNQPPPFRGHDVFGSDVALLEATLELGRQANADPPVLLTHDRYGHRLDVVDYHPAYHDLVSTAVAHGR